MAAVKAKNEGKAKDRFQCTEQKKVLKEALGNYKTIKGKSEIIKLEVKYI